MQRGPLKLFFSYAHEDADARSELDDHLDLLERQQVVLPWSDRQITPGREWAGSIEENLRAADIILLLISRPFLESPFVREVEIPQALAQHDQGKARVLPVLLEPVDDLPRQAFGKLEVLPSKGVAISQWDDRARALADVVEGIRRAATEIVWERGGPFEFGPHPFTEAELVDLDEPDRTWALARLRELHDELTRAVPPRLVDRNLLVANWTLHSRPRLIGLPECVYYLAAVMSAFDIVTLQKLPADLAEVEELLRALGPDWGYFVTDVSEGKLGLNERFAIFYYQPRVQFDHVSGEVVLQTSALIDGDQFARKPLIASFRAGSLRFRVCTAHLYYGAAGARSTARRVREAKALADTLVRKTSKPDSTSIILSGDLNIGEKGSPVVAALREAGIELPDSLLLPTLAASGQYADVIGFVPGDRPFELGPSSPNRGVFDHRGVLFTAEQAPHYRDRGAYDGDDEPARFTRWANRIMSDHLPLWVELAT